MIFFSNSTATVEVVNTSRTDTANYSVIFQNSTTKAVWVVPAEDKRTAEFRHTLTFEVPDDMPKGEYNYYVVANPDGADVSVDNNNVYNSTINGEEIDVYHMGVAKYIFEETATANEYNLDIIYNAYERYN